MLINYYTLRALADEWNARLQDALIADAFSQSRDALTLILEKGTEHHSLHVRLDNVLRCVYRRDGASKARRNVATMLPDVVGQRVASFSVAAFDRHLYLDLAQDLRIQITPFGPRPNVYLVGADGVVRDAFLRREAEIGSAAPEIRPAVPPESPEALVDRWPSEERRPERALMCALPLLDRVLAREVVTRAGVEENEALGPESDRLRVLWESLTQVLVELGRPTPRIYTSGAESVFSLIPLRQLQDESVESFDSVDAAARTFAHRYLSERAFTSRRDPVRKRLADELERLDRSLARMGEELSSESRADRYERWGHVLMAQAHAVPPGIDHVILPDVFETGVEIRIPLDPALSPMENARRYYERARRTRTAREHAAARVEDLSAQRASVKEALLDMDGVQNQTQLNAFEERHAPLLERLTRSGGGAPDRPRFRSFRVAGGFEVLVGKNAAQNEMLTFEVASRDDVWMHARGTPGSHVVLRLPSRNAEPPKPALEEAASIAAYFSKASGSGLVPVIVTRRKYVRRAKKAPPGTVLVDREEVLIVPPRLPDSDTADES
ncbi:MAG TPA: NFACT RNA binding domain-containing protein [Rhodothermales bacterium]